MVSYGRKKDATGTAVISLRAKGEKLVNHRLALGGGLGLFHFPCGKKSGKNKMGSDGEVGRGCLTKVA